jgi:hypothetical protein
MNALELAKLALLVLETQKQYFNTRERDTLIRSKALEGQLRKAAERIVMDDKIAQAKLEQAQMALSPTEDFPW